MSNEELDQIFRRYWSTMWGYISDMGFTAETAEDLASAVFVKLVRHRDNIDPEKVKSWLYQVARTTAIDHARTAQRRVQQAELTELIPSMNRMEDPFYVTCLIVDMECVQAMQKQLPDNMNVLIASEIFGFSRTELARKLDSKIGAIAARKNRAVRACRYMKQLNNAHQNDII